MDALLRHAKLIIGFTVVGAVVGAAIGVLQPRPFAAEARVELGTRFLNGWLMHPLGAAARLEALAQTHPSWTPEVRVSVTTKRRRGTNEITRFMTLRVEASTASAAETLRNFATKRWQKEHEQFTQYERQTLLQQQAALNELHAKLQNETSFDPAVQLANVGNLLRGTNHTLSETQLFNSRVLANRPVAQPPKKLLIWTLTGAGTGLLLALGFLVFGNAEKQEDIIVESFVSLSRRYAPLIGCVLTVVTAAAVALAFARPPKWTGTSVVEPAVVLDRPIAEVDALAERLRRSVPNRLSQRMPEVGRLDIRVVRDQPPQNPQVNLLKAFAEDESAEVVEALLQELFEQITQQQSATVDTERVRLSQNRKQLELELARLKDAPFTPAIVKPWSQSIIERAKAERALNAIRTHPPYSLQDPLLRPKSRTGDIAVHLMAGLAAGLGLGYAFAFLFAGVRARGRRERS